MIQLCVSQVLPTVFNVTMCFAGFADGIGVTNPHETVTEVCSRFGADVNMNMGIMNANQQMLLKRQRVCKDSKLDPNIAIFGLPSADNVAGVLVCVFSIWMCVCVVCF